MRARKLIFELYADQRGLEWVTGLVDDAARARGARVVARAVREFPADGGPGDDADGLLAEQWAYEHPGQDPAGRRQLELCVRVVCSLRVWRALRRAVIRGLCPESDAPHACRVPWAAR